MLVNLYVKQQYSYKVEQKSAQVILYHADTHSNKFKLYTSVKSLFTCAKKAYNHEHFIDFKNITAIQKNFFSKILKSFFI